MPFSKGTFLPDTEPPFVLVYLQLLAFAELWRTAKQINHSAGNHSVGMLETYAEVDKSLADLNEIPPNSACLKTAHLLKR